MIPINSNSTNIYPLNVSIPLSDLCPGESAIVSALEMSGSMRRRLLDIGLVPGTHVTCIGRSPGGDPSAYWIRGAVIAIRSQDSNKILVKMREEEQKWA